VALPYPNTVTHYYTASHPVAWSVGLFRTRVGQVNHVLHKVHADTNMGRGNFEGKEANHCKVGYKDTPRPSVQTRLNRSSCLWVVGSHGPKASCFTWWSMQIPHLTGQFRWIGAPIVNYRHFLPWAVRKRLNRSICRLGCGLEWAEWCIYSIVFTRWGQCALMAGHVAVTFPSSNIEPFVYGGDAPYVKLLWLLVILGHAHLDSRTHSPAFEPNTVLWAFHTIEPSSYNMRLLEPERQNEMNSRRSRTRRTVDGMTGILKSCATMKTQELNARENGSSWKLILS